jgi:hypothetical protein
MDRLCGLVVRVPGYRSRGPGFDSRRYQIFWEVVGLERGPLSLVRIIDQLLEWKSSGSGLENREYGREDSLRWPRDTLHPQKLALTPSTSGGQATKFFFVSCVCVVTNLKKSIESQIITLASKWVSAVRYVEQLPLKCTKIREYDQLCLFLHMLMRYPSSLLVYVFCTNCFHGWARNVPGRTYRICVWNALNWYIEYLHDRKLKC